MMWNIFRSFFVSQLTHTEIRFSSAIAARWVYVLEACGHVREEAEVHLFVCFFFSKIFFMFLPSFSLDPSWRQCSKQGVYNWCGLGKEWS